MQSDGFDRLIIIKLTIKLDKYYCYLVDSMRMHGTR
jgi:hypothetical protein